LLSFGFYNGTAAVLSRAYDSIPLMLFGRTMGLPSTGVFYRALSICQLPDKMFLAGVLQVALPALSRAAQEGLDLKSAYLRGVQQITALYWPALAMMAILAHPIVDLLLGAQWKAVVPLLQIMAISWMFAFSNELSYGLLVSLGGVRDHLIRSAIIWPVSGALLVGASFWGPAAAAMALCVAVPFQWLVTFLVVRRRLTITFREMALALRPSAIVTGATAAAPLAAAYLLTNGGFEMSLAQAIALAGLSAAGWATAMIALKHPLWDELRLILTRVASILGLKPA
jgi:O-antigen/teichoic acid export membrane protein